MRRGLVVVEQKPAGRRSVIQACIHDGVQMGLALRSASVGRRADVHPLSHRFCRPTPRAIESLPAAAAIEPSTLPIGRPAGISRPLRPLPRCFFKPTQPTDASPAQQRGQLGLRTGAAPTQQQHRTTRVQTPEHDRPTDPAARRSPTHPPGGGMTATSRPPRRPRIRPRGPPPAPPTPIRTARGARSAAADERVLAEFLEASLRVPDLALPPRAPRNRFFSFPPPGAPPLREVPSQALASGDADAALRAASTAAESGAFAVAGAIDAREVREAVEASRAVFAAPDEVKREQLARWFPRKEDDPTAGGEEFCWFRPVSSDDDRALGAALPGSTYRVFREKVDTVASRMENVAKNAIRVLAENVKSPKDSALSGEAPSILCLRLHNSNKSKAGWDDFGSTDPPKSHALSIHLSERDRRICLRNQGGSTIFSLPACSMLVTVGKQVQEWSNGQFRTAVGEVLYEMTDEPGPSISLELVYSSPDDLHLSEVGRQARCIDRPKAVSFRDQILVALILLFLFYVFWR